MTVKIESLFRAQIAEFLPDALMRAITQYELLMKLKGLSGKTEALKLKNFTAHLSALKGAVAHIELLLKLAKWADLPDGEAVDRNDHVILTALMLEAEERLVEYRGEVEVVQDRI